MRTVKMFLALMMVCFFALQVNAQDASFSDVVIVNNGDETATVTMQVSGSMAGTVGDIIFAATGNSVKGGSASEYLYPGNLLMPNPVFVATFSIDEEAMSSNEEEWVDIEITYALVTGGPKKLIKKARMPKLVTGKCQGCF
ncbi:MAG: hypothetical protein IPP17_24630 [Bacteroidetes bacterium]|nr:hypothetical protein [Bacteroidota bacterium]